MAPKKRNNNTNSTVLSINNVNLGPNEKANSNYKSISYTVNGQKYSEVINLDVQNATFLQPAFAPSFKKNVDTKRGTRVRSFKLNTNNEEGKAIINSEERKNAYSGAITEVYNEAVENGNEVLFQNSAAESGVDLSGANIPDNNENIDTEVVEEVDDAKPAEITGKKSSKPAPHLWYPQAVDYVKGNMDHIFIESFKYQAPQSGMSFFNKPEKGDKTGASLGSFVTKGIPRGSNIAGGTNFAGGSSDTSKSSQGSVKLPIPNSLKSSNGVSWGGAKANAVEAGAFFGASREIGNLMKGETNLVGMVKSGLGDASNALSEVRKDMRGGGASGDILSATLSKLALSKIGINVDPAQFITRSTGNAINPNLELLFNGPQLRNFTFAFQFAPYDKEDATEIRKIMRFFKQGMLPSFANESEGSSIFLSSPNVFRLAYRTGTNRIKSLNMFKMCALTACEIDYTPEGVWAAYADQSAGSQPISSNMALSFTELTPIFGNDYDEKPDESIRDLTVGASGATPNSTPTIAEDDVGF
tara:strand:+ start:11915 stop:13501 length:1587 start_codon:yes stop_codon:yes gene_type:complete